MNDLVLTDVAPDPAFVAAMSEAIEKARADQQRTVRWWHWLHRWSQWGKTYRQGGFAAAFGGGQLRQQRSCVRCGLLQDRACEVKE